MHKSRENGTRVITSESIAYALAAVRIAERRPSTSMTGFPTPNVANDEPLSRPLPPADKSGVVSTRSTCDLH